MPSPIRNILALLLVSGCSTMVAHSSRDKLLGMSAPDLVACAGKPDDIMQTKPDVLVAEWAPKTTSSSSKSSGVSFSILGTSLTVTPPVESCHMQATILRDGTVAAVALSSTTGVLDDDGSCAQLVAECVFHPDDTGLPKGYDAFLYFLPTAVNGKGAGK